METVLVYRTILENNSHQHLHSSITSSASQHALQGQPQPALPTPGHHQEEHVQPVIVSSALEEHRHRGRCCAGPSAS